MTRFQRSERTIRIGGKTKSELLADLKANHVELNEAAKLLFDQEAFQTSPKESLLSIVEVSLNDLGFPQGAIYAEVCRRASEEELTLCPLELSPHLRLQFLDQPEGHLGHPVVKHQAPPGALIVASAPLVEDDAVPKGFYLRRIDGVLWLRGYWSSPDHLCGPEERYVFCRIVT